MANTFGGEMVMQQSPCHATAAGGKLSSSMFSIDADAGFGEILMGIDGSMIAWSRSFDARRSSRDVKFDVEWLRFVRRAWFVDKTVIRLR